VSDDGLRETLLSTRPIHQGRLLGFRDDTVRLATGAEAHREVVEHPGAVAVVAVDAMDRVILVRQWRHAIGRAIWELPAGTCDVDGEALEQTARRELGEETGFAAEHWRALGAAPLTPGYSTEVMHFFAAAGLSPVGSHLAEDEIVEVGHFDAAGVAALLRSSELDVKTLAGLALAGRAVANGC
jgi:8-oxo-dGTP pyrophosphatase MutT (NUDIX family)